MDEPAPATSESPETTRAAWIRRGTIAVLLVGGVILAVWSWLIKDTDLWWSSFLSNLSVTVVLLVPAEFALRWVRVGIRQLATTTEEAKESAESARASAERSEATLETVRQSLLGRQQKEHEKRLDVFRNIAMDPSRESLLRALRAAACEEIISGDGVRVPVWETDLHYRFVVDGPQADLEVRLESDDATVLGSAVWDADEDPQTFYQCLVELVREAGADLGVGLNDPTESVEQLSSMLVEVARLRAQELMGYRTILHRIIERRDGWYFTEDDVVVGDDLHYHFAIDRLDEIDWVQHLENRGWYGAESAISFARRLYSPAMISRASGRRRR